MGIGPAYPAGPVAGAVTPNNIVVINQLSDLPTPSGGTITLLNNTSYQLGAAINIGTDTITFSAGSDLSSAGAFIATLIYTGTGSMLNGVDVNCTVKDIALLAANGKVYDFSETTGGANLVIIGDVLVIDCDSVGTFDKLGTLVMEGSTVINCETGMDFLGATTNSLRLASVQISSTSTTFIGLDFTGSTQKSINFAGVILNGGTGSIGIKGDAASANITTGFLANVGNVQFGGVTTPLSGITVKDIRWNFQNNGGIPDTLPDSLITLNDNATETVISAVNTPTLVAGTWAVERESHFTATAAGRVTYNGERDIDTPLQVTMTLDPASGSNKNITAYIALNGSVITDSHQTIRINSANPLQITIPWQLTLSEDDYIEVFIENNTDAINVTAVDATLRVR